jgi:hypothetical protein
MFDCGNKLTKMGTVADIANAFFLRLSFADQEKDKRPFSFAVNKQKFALSV